MKRLVLLLVLASALFGHGAANAVVITFTEVFSDPPTTARSLVGNEWSAFGITTSNAYWYADTRDPFDTKGIANDSNPGIVNFTVPTLSVTADWLTVGGNGITLQAYDSGGALLDSFSVGALSDPMSGTRTLSGGLIASLQWHDSAGFATISTLTFTPVPEPSTFALAGVAGAALMITRRREQ